MAKIEGQFRRMTEEEFAERNRDHTVKRPQTPPGPQPGDWTSGFRAQAGDRVYCRPHSFTPNAVAFHGVVEREMKNTRGETLDYIIVQADDGRRIWHRRGDTRIIVAGAIDPLPEDMDEDQYLDLMYNYD